LKLLESFPEESRSSIKTVSVPEPFATQYLNSNLENPDLK